MAPNKVTAPLIITYVVAFFEGLTLLPLEIVSAKKISPFFGSSLIVWSSVLGLTLLSLGAGYFLGGRISARVNSLFILLIMLMASGLYLVLSGLIGNGLMSWLVEFSLYVGAPISFFILFVPPLVGMSISGPVLTQYISKNDVRQSGKSAGVIFAISSAGGVFGLYFFSLYIIPEFGTCIAIYLLTSTLVLPSLLLLPYSRNQVVID